MEEVRPWSAGILINKNLTVRGLAREPSEHGDDKIEHMLAKTSPFSNLGRRTIEEIAKTSDRVHYSPGEFVVREGEMASGFFVILGGQVEVQRRGAPLRRLGPGQFFGETSLLEGESRSADIVAIQPTFCLKIDDQKFRELVRATPRVSAKILEEIIRRNRTVVKVSTPTEEGKDLWQEKFEFRSELAKKAFESLVDSFVHDYMVKKIVGERCGWRSVTDIAQETGASVRSFYGKQGGIGSALAETIKRGLIETRYFTGERGRGGEIMRFRVVYEKEPVRAYVNHRIRAGKKS